MPWLDKAPSWNAVPAECERSERKCELSLGDSTMRISDTLRPTLRTGGRLLCLSLFLAPPAALTAPSADEVMRKAEQVAYFQGDDGRARVSMTIRDKRGATRKRTLTILRKDKSRGGGSREQKYYVYLHYPADVKDTVLMVWKHSGRDDDRWLYLPALDLVKRIAAGDKRTSFLGSDFFYEDISGRSISQDRFKLLETTDKYYVVEGKPRSPGKVEFSRYKAWIHRSSHLPVKVEFYDKQGRKHRVYEAQKVDKIQGNPTVTRSKMRNLQSGTETTLSFSKVRYDIGLDENIFTERRLRNPPRSQLK